MYPRLRERADDIPLLAEHFLTRYAQKYKRPGMKFDKVVLGRLKKYTWPGNIRELQHAVERAIILTEGKVIASEAPRLPAAHHVNLPLLRHKRWKRWRRCLFSRR